MGSFRTFDHTADLGLSIEAESLDDLFATAGEALVATIVANPQDIASVENREISLDAPSLDELLVRWLNELIYFVETQNFVGSRFHVRIQSQPDRHILSAVVDGEAGDLDRHVLDHEVKAATRHGLFVRQRADSGWEAEVIVDI